MDSDPATVISAVAGHAKLDFKIAKFASKQRRRKNQTALEQVLDEQEAGDTYVGML